MEKIWYKGCPQELFSDFEFREKCVRTLFRGVSKFLTLLCIFFYSSDEIRYQNLYIELLKIYVS